MLSAVKCATSDLKTGLFCAGPQKEGACNLPGVTQKGNRPRMSSTQRLAAVVQRHQHRTACAGCGRRGRYELSGYLSHDGDAWLWHGVYQCHVCATALRDMLGPGTPIGDEILGPIDADDQLKGPKPGAEAGSLLREVSSWGEEVEQWLEQAS